MHGGCPHLIPAASIVPAQQFDVPAESSNRLHVRENSSLIEITIRDVYLRVSSIYGQYPLYSLQLHYEVLSPAVKDERNK